MEGESTERRWRVAERRWREAEILKQAEGIERNLVEAVLVDDCLKCDHADTMQTEINLHLLAGQFHHSSL